MYFAAGKLDAPGVMLTASHNPAQYNGMKLCLAGARPVGEDTGLREIKALAAEQLPPVDGPAGGRQSLDLLRDFAAPRAVLRRPHRRCVRSRSSPTRPTAWAASWSPPCSTASRSTSRSCTGSSTARFPNHPADPIQAENQRDLQARVLEVGADVGLAFDGDADRVFLVDELGQTLSGSLTTAIVAAGVLEKQPGSTILYNCICSKAVPEVIRERGGTPIRTKVGHSFIKSVMAETGAAFGGEHSAHYYFRDNWRADSGSIAALLVLEQLSKSGQPLSELRKPFDRYAASGEINATVGDPAAVIEHVAAAYPSDAQDRLDGLTVDLGEWWFNLRASNTEPLLRLNLEAPDDAESAVRESSARATRSKPSSLARSATPY